MNDRLVELFHKTTGPCDCKDCKIKQLEAENKRYAESAEMRTQRILEQSIKIKQLEADIDKHKQLHKKSEELLTKWQTMGDVLERENQRLRGGILELLDEYLFVKGDVVSIHLIIKDLRIILQKALPVRDYIFKQSTGGIDEL